jgi:hypothetical protein
LVAALSVLLFSAQQVAGSLIGKFTGPAADAVINSVRDRTERQPVEVRDEIKGAAALQTPVRRGL